MHQAERSPVDRPFRDGQPRSDTLPLHAPHPRELPTSTPDGRNAVAPPSPGDPLSLVTRREVLILVTGTLLFPASAAARRDDPFQDDARLRQTLTVRVSRMPLAELFQRLGAALGVHLFAEGDDVGDQKIDLVARDLPGTEILTAITNLLNSEGPNGYQWERSGQGPRYRYLLVRDIASRTWEKERAAEADGRLSTLLRARLSSLAREPFTPHPDRPNELPGMRKLVAALSGAQIAELAAERILILTGAACLPGQRPLLKELVDQAVAAASDRWPERTQQRIATYGHPAKDPTARAEIYLNGDAPRWHIWMSVRATKLNEVSEVCRVDDPAALGRIGVRRQPASALLAGHDDPVFGLPPRSSWLMGDVLADIAARARINLIADDYTQEWPRLSHCEGARPLSAWLTAIREEYDYEPAWDGPFLRLRNRVWWLDRRQEIPIRLLRRWEKLIGGTSAERLQAAVEVTGWAPHSPNPHTAGFRLRVLEESPEISRLSAGFVDAVGQLETDLRIYRLLTPAQQRQITGPGLTLTWAEMDPALRDLFARRVRSSVRPGIREEDLQQSRLTLQFVGDLLNAKYQLAPPGVAPEGWEQGSLATNPAARPENLVGQPAPELQIETESGETRRLQPRGPLFLYIAPAWPRPMVERAEQFPELRAAQQLGEASPQSGARILVLGASGTAAELRRWWKERGLALPPQALSPESAQQLGVRHLPVAMVVDRRGCITWAKEGYADGDEAEWRRQLERAGG
jgi:hypothetical protein